jgi:hypothetical protein
MGNQQLLHFINRMVSDQRLRPRHMAMLAALCDAWIASNFQGSYHVSRSRLMSAAKISAKPTYHKVIKELQALGYFEYRPSYHPKEGSTIILRGISNEAINSESTSI